MLPLASKDNRHFKSAVRVRNGKDKGLIFVEGRRLAVEAVRSRLKIAEAFFSRSFAASNENAGVLGAVEDRAGSSFELSDKLFDQLADTKTPQGIALICERPSHSLENLRIERDGAMPLAVVLDRISNPGNLGAVLRTAEAAGASCVVTTMGSADAFAPAVLRGSMGAAFRLPIVEKRPLEEIAAWARSQGAALAATSAEGTKDYTEADLVRPLAIFFGSEAHGLDSAAVEWDETVRIPLERDVESLNLAVSAGIILFETKRRRT